MGRQFNEAEVLHATLCEIERGLFQVTYRVDGVAVLQHPLPRYQVGSCALDARVQVEQRAQECGYPLIVWETGFTQPMSVRPHASGNRQLSS